MSVYFIYLSSTTVFDGPQRDQWQGARITQAAGYVSFGLTMHFSPSVILK
jgi:hypothetical protein